MNASVDLRPEALRGARDVIEGLLRAGVRFTHWKSNHKLELGMAGHDDLDLLVHREDAARLIHVLVDHDFRMVDSEYVARFPTIHQFVGLDPETQRWIHLDVYFSVTTGTTHLKEFRLPLTEALLSGTERLSDVPVPRGGAELLVLVLREMIAKSSLMEVAVRPKARSSADARAEIEELLRRDPDAIPQAHDLLSECLPELDVDLWQRCLESLVGSSSPVRRFALGRAVRNRLRAYRRLDPIRGFLQFASTAARALLRIRRSGGTKRLATGGAVIAFVGPEATGKSTLTAATASWLRAHFDVEVVHLGKPPPTILTAPLNALTPLARRLLPGKRVSVAPTRSQRRAVEARFPDWLQVARSLSLAWDRRALARYVHRRAANGAIMICDRYPSPDIGAMDSAHLAPALARNPFQRRAAEVEQRLYGRIVGPTLAIRLTTPLDVALLRNRMRIKPGKESDDYVAHRHAHQSIPAFPNAITWDLNTDQEENEVLRQIKRELWRRL